MSEINLDLFIDEIFSSGGLNLTATSDTYDDYDVETTNQLLIDSQAEEIVLLRNQCERLERCKPKRKYPPTNPVCCYKKQLLNLSQSLIASATLAHKHIRMDIGGTAVRIDYKTPASPKDEWDYPDTSDFNSDDSVDYPLEQFLDSNIGILE